MGIIETLIQNNEAPILFIGAGISKRYISSAMSWQQLLSKIAEEVEIYEDEFFRRLSKIRENCKRENVSESEMLFFTNVKIATDLETCFNQRYYDKEIDLDGFSPRDIFENQYSPMKVFICNITKDLTIVDSKKDEIEALSLLLSKARSVVTTNYDSLLEKLAENSLQVLIEPSDLYLNRDEYGQLLKIHGSTDFPNSIIINEKDYEEFEKNSLLISSKLIAMLLESPIIFLGYSLNDKNIIDIFKNFTRSLSPKQRSDFRDRCIFINYVPGQKELLHRYAQIDSINTEISVIDTDNYLSLYQNLNSINQGLRPSEVRKYQAFIRQLIVEKGRKGTLKTTLVGSENLERLDDTNVVVAIGDEKHIYIFPTRLDYFKSYVGIDAELNPTMALKFVANHTSNSYLPVHKILLGCILETIPLQESEIQKIKDRAKRNEDLVGEMKIPKENRKEFITIDEIWNCGEKISKKLDYVTYNIRRLDLLNVYELISRIVGGIRTSEELKEIGSQLGKLIVVYDVMKYKDEYDQQKTY